MKRNRNNSLLDRALLRRSLRESFIKLDPRKMVRNPIMFTVEAVTFVMLALLIYIAVTGDASQGFAAVQLHRLRRPAGYAPLRQLRRSHRRSPRQGAGRQPAQDPRGDARKTHRAGWPVAHRQQLGPPAGRPLRVRRGRHDRRRRRDRRGTRLDRRKRRHGRIGPGDPRGGR